MSVTSSTVPENETIVTTMDPDCHEVPVFGLPGPIFYVTHIAALVCMSITIGISIVILVVFFRKLKHPDKRLPREQNELQPPKNNYKVFTLGRIDTGVNLTSWRDNADITTGGIVKNSANVDSYTMGLTHKTFWKCPLAERLVVYLAIADLTLALFHSIGNKNFMLVLCITVKIEAIVT